jgi:hypothetical protein
VPHGAPAEDGARLQAVGVGDIVDEKVGGGILDGGIQHHLRGADVAAAVRGRLPGHVGEHLLQAASGRRPRLTGPVGGQERRPRDSGKTG